MHFALTLKDRTEKLFETEKKKEKKKMLLSLPNAFADMQNTGTGVLNPVYREQEHSCFHTKLDGTRLLPHVRCWQRLQGAQEISPYGNISLESVSLNTLYVHVYLTIQHQPGKCFA